MIFLLYINCLGRRWLNLVRISARPHSYVKAAAEDDDSAMCLLSEIGDFLDDFAVLKRD
jgi:hypothetical protein